MLSQINRTAQPKGNDRVYYNVSIRNNDQTTDDIVAEFSEERNTAILNKANDYYLTLVRFSIPGTYIPLFIFQTEHGSANVNEGIYKVAMSFGGVDYQESVIYIPSASFPAPAGPNTVNSNKNIYYWVYDYNLMFEMINNAIEAAWTAMTTAQPASLTLCPVPPFYIFDPVTQLRSIIAPQEMASVGAATLKHDFYMRRWTDGIETLYNAAAPVLKWTILVKNRNNNQWWRPGAVPVVPPYDPSITYPIGTYLEMVQNYPSMSLLTSFKSLVFTTASIPIEFENTGTLNTEGQTTFQSILTDFEPIIQNAGDERSVFSYFPQGPYRLVNLNSDQELKKLDFKVWWSDQGGTLYPLSFRGDEELTVKFLFIRKESLV